MNIVVGYLPTREGSAALDHAIALARRTTDVRLVVVNTGRHGDDSHAHFASGQDIDAIEAELTAAGVDHEVRQPASKDSAAEAIIDTAAAVGADLIVIGMRRRNPVGKIITGSTAQAVLMDASCPVLSVKPGQPPVL